VDRDVPIVVVDSGPSAAAEVEAAVHAAALLARSGVPEDQLGVVAPFRATVAAVRRLLEAVPEAAGCTVDTVDRFQGGQREAMIVCLGLSGIGYRTHAFVDDPRRLNVAFTRARAKLVVIGDLEAARTLPTVAGFLHHCLDHGMPTVAADWAMAGSAKPC
jgi:DNA replication ATP-dependent helicase Dna2